MYIVTRTIILLFSVSVWHQHINELITDTLPSNKCRLYHWSFFLVTFLHFLVTLWLFFYCERVLTYVYPLITTIFGAFVVMSIKPSEWLFSFKWTDCNGMYDSSNVIGRVSLFSYALLMSSALEILELSTEEKLTAFAPMRDLNFNVKILMILITLAVLMFGICAIMVAIAGGFT